MSDPKHLWPTDQRLPPVSDWTDEQVADVLGVHKVTAIDEDGVVYSVDVVLKSMSRHAFEEGEDRRGVWDAYVLFAQDAAHRAGGPAFAAVAREQDKVALAICQRVWPAIHQPPEEP